MAPHRSLNAPKMVPRMIVPVETMEPYDLCWCDSGKKYKWCHFRREQQKPINVYEIEAAMHAELRAGYCAHPDPDSDPCSTTIVRSHTVQKKGGLAAIAEDGHVMTVKPSMKELIKTQGNPQPQKIGVNKASVFPGFCGRHDTELFKPIEGKSLTLTKATAFLFSYRAIAYERFSKEAQLRNIDIQREADRGHPFFKQAMIQTHLATFVAGAKIGMRDVDAWKTEFDARLLSGALDDFHYAAVRFDRVLPVVACGAFHPEYDFQGQQLQKLGRTDVDLEHVTITVTTFDAQTILVFGWIGSFDSPAKAIADSFIAVDDLCKADALVRLLFVHTDNLFLRPSWWEALGDIERRALNQMTRSGTTMRLRNSGELSGDGTSFVSANVVEVVSG
ncbi:SEC-C domain-containing protein [Agrobacterium sp. FDAARGOS_525]|uniref:SEC-C domain-containing protein n=1 Tax=Agrobacterium sp. FDAARGOS_525 TaxID=2420311 RepID=UPI000F674D25|nr:SEC-C domain-containing protein [Agrobacterium sp. FDAARGOS_525]RSC31568.1 SEC-C domain-containing protein [Agrobacterium sp. FDAARGOS_525]